MLVGAVAVVGVDLADPVPGARVDILCDGGTKAGLNFKSKLAMARAVDDGH
ncbi:hypothetical protein [Saccharopolyspora mangrovi]|uniref:Uncharacterized protein n=1 Tax=Saccharopolyspora mangrovi TaxID=3082379 RepID=A0ABU6AEW7_9PSEU|nr:hypothetical protein [Saccharopolyspora sp. S2-29]MEB3370086.1 hypothetical protein [Saccharopolyspora sp. S2-29]